MSDPKLETISQLFNEWNADVARAQTLLTSEDFFVEGVLVLSCYIGALARLRYPLETKDWRSYKTIVWEYSGQRAIYENIDLLFFYQWPNSKLANNKAYNGIKNYPELIALFKGELGDEDQIRNEPRRYQKREDLVRCIKNKKVGWFDENNFGKHIELFSNNQILYEFLRCEAVHNADIRLFNRSYQVAQKKTIYKDNHQIDRSVILNTVKGIVENLKNECLGNRKWPWEL